MLFVFDCGSQYSGNLARRLEFLGVPYVMKKEFDAIDRAKGYSGFIISGSPSSVYDSDAPNIPEEIWTYGVPVLGICYGMQVMAHALGGRVVRAGDSADGDGAPRGAPSYGHSLLITNGFSIGAWAAPSESRVWMSHGDSVVKPPPTFQLITTPLNSSVIATMCDPARKFYGLQFHPEVEHTVHGDEWLAAFARVCALEPLDEAARLAKHQRLLKDLETRTAARIGQRVGIVAVSGGVDSTTLGVFLQKLGANVHCIFIDNGFLRKDECAEVTQALTTCGLARVHVIQAADEFIKALEGVTEPDQKRVIIGRVFARILAEQAQQLGAEWMGQGTLASDVIESGHAGGAAIKRHHNVGGMPTDFPLELVEPFRELYKDQVRALADQLSMPTTTTWRHPFPGPGLAIRVAGEVTAERLESVRAADAIFVEELRERDLYSKCAQAFAVLLEGRSVGVTGDARAYKEVVCLRAVSTSDYMTADWVALDKPVLDAISSRITNEVPSIGRVLFDITQKPPATIEWE